MALPDIEVRVTADTDSAEAGLKRTGDQTERLSRRLSNATSRSRRFGLGIQNAAFQAGDFAVQVGGGVDASRALAQQLPQLLGGFGVLGAVLGAVVAIAIPLREAMKGLAEDGRDVTQVFGTLQPVARAVADAMGRMGEIVISAAELLVNNIDRILVIGATAAAFFAGKWVAAFVAARVATFSLSTALVALRGALIRTGIGALIVGVGELVFQFTRLVKAAGGVGEAWGMLRSLASEVFSRISDRVALLGVDFRIFVNEMQFKFVTALHSMASEFAEFASGIAKNLNSIFNLGLNENIGSGMLGGLADTMTSINDQFEGLIARQGELNENLNAPLESLEAIREALASMEDEGITLDGILGGADEDGEGGGLKEKLTEREEAIKEHLDRIRALTQGTLGDKLGAWGDYFSNLASLMGTNNQKLLGIAKSFAAAQALIDAYQAYTQTISDPTLPWFAKLAAGANVLAAGIGAVNAIKSVSAGGGSVRPGIGAGGVSSAAPARQDSLLVTLNGSGSVPVQEIPNLFNMLQDEAGDRNLVFARR